MFHAYMEFRSCSSSCAEVTAGLLEILWNSGGANAETWCEFSSPAGLTQCTSISVSHWLTADTRIKTLGYLHRIFTWQFFPILLSPSQCLMFFIQKYLFYSSTLWSLISLLHHISIWKYIFLCAESWRWKTRTAKPNSAPFVAG